MRFPAGRRGAGRKAGLRFAAGVLSGFFPIAVRAAVLFLALRLGAVFFLAIVFFVPVFFARVLFAGDFFAAAFFGLTFFFVTVRLMAFFRVAIFFALRFEGTDALPADFCASGVLRDFLAAVGFFARRLAPPVPLPDFALVRRAAMEETPLLFVDPVGD